MDYSKSGSANGLKQGPRAKRMTTKGAPTPKGDDKGNDKAALLERMKAAAAQPPKPAPKG
jgi:hypothetical protein